jgi:hypothetical protein
MVDFKKALSKDRYNFMKSHHPEEYADIVAFASTFAGITHPHDFSMYAKVEDYCMGLACRMYRKGENAIRDLVPR